MFWGMDKIATLTELKQALGLVPIGGKLEFEAPVGLVRVRRTHGGQATYKASHSKDLVALDAHEHAGGHDFGSVDKTLGWLGEVGGYARADEVSNRIEEASEKLARPYAYVSADGLLALQLAGYLSGAVGEQSYTFKSEGEVFARTVRVHVMESLGGAEVAV